MSLLTKALRSIERRSARLLFRRPQLIRTEQPYISFTFDDFPRSALHTGGEILKKFGLAGTYYTALGLLGTESPSGPVCDADDLRKAILDGHELGCHTFAHCDAWHTPSGSFEESILRNRAALRDLLPDAEFKTMSYPISEPRLMVKRRSSAHFGCCRAGGQRFNARSFDRNLLAAFFLEQAGGNLETVRELIRANARSRGWLIFATHDISPRPSAFGCTPEFFEAVVRSAVESGARILPVWQAFEQIATASVRGRDLRSAVADA